MAGRREKLRYISMEIGGLNRHGGSKGSKMVVGVGKTP